MSPGPSYTRRRSEDARRPRRRPARDELAKRLKAEGRADEAAALKERRKPAVTQWIAAQVRRHHGDVVDALRGAMNNIAEAQETAITSGDRDALRHATETDGSRWLRSGGPSTTSSLEAAVPPATATRC